MINKDDRVFRLISLFRSAFGDYKYQIGIIAALSFLGAIFEAIGVNAIIPLFSFVDSAQTGAGDVISQAIEKFFLYFNLSYTIKSLLIFITLLFIVKAIVLFYTQYIIARITADYGKKTRGELFKLTLETNWPYLSKQKVGYLDQILTTDVNFSSALLFYIGGSILTITNLIIYGLIVVNISFVIAMLTLFLGGVIFLVFKPLFYKNRIASGELAEKYKQLAHYVNENIIGMKTVKSMFVETEVFKKGLAYFGRMRDLDVRVAALKNFTNAVLQPVGVIFIIGIFAFFYKTSVFNFASFAVIVYAINKVFANIQLAQSQIHVMSSQAPHLMSVLRYKDEAIKHKEKDEGTNKFNFNDRLELKDIGFTYNSQDNVLSYINFFVNKGEMIGLVGPSGVGKTTLVDLLLRLLEPKEGTILLDGKNISTISMQEWRTNIGYVSQDIFLINDTIENNIKFFDESVSQEDIVAAAKTANIYEFIESQQKQFETVVGERGMRLSGGQRQRIVLARALARKPQILILDEATSALDNESEVLIQKSIERLKGTMTVIAIAHRLSTVMISDKLIVLENGRIIEEGAPHDLLKNEDSHFFKMYNVRS